MALKKKGIGVHTDERNLMKDSRTFSFWSLEKDGDFCNKSVTPSCRKWPRNSVCSFWDGKVTTINLIKNNNNNKIKEQMVIEGVEKTGKGCLDLRQSKKVATSVTGCQCFLNITERVEQSSRQAMSPSCLPFR